MAKRLDAASAEFLAQRAASYERAGKVVEALADWTEAFNAQPRRGEWAHRAGLLMVRCVKYREAVTMLRRAVALMPRSPMVVHDLGHALFRDGQYAEAAKCFERSGFLEPDQPVHFAHLAFVRERLRDDAGARAAAEKAIEINPNHGAALLVVGDAQLRGGDPEAAIRTAERALATPLPYLMVARGHHLIGRAHEKLKNADEAFEAHMRGNRAILEHADGRAALAAPVEDRMRRLRREGLAERFRRWADEAPANTPDPVFLCGFPRSGTTLIEQVIGALDGLATNDEQANSGIVLEALERETPGILAGDLSDILDGIPTAKLPALRKLYWDEIVQRIPSLRSGMTAIDKQPLRLLDIGLTQRLFPRARFLVMIRDPRDVCLSALFQNFDPNPAMARFLQVETTGRFYAEVMRFWIEMRDIITMPWMEVRYEDLVRDFERVTKDVAAFLGVPWTDAVNRFNDAARSRAVTSASYNAVTEGINSRSLGRWQAYRDHLWPILRDVEPILRAYGYEPA